MVYNRKAIAPWSTERSQGIESATVDSNIETPQYLQPTVNTGVIDLNGNWIGNQTSDKLFKGFTLAEAIPNGAVALFPDTNSFPSINMTGFSDIFLALKASTGGNYKIEAVMGPDSLPYANLTPVDAAGPLRGTYGTVGNSIGNLLVDNVEVLVIDVWNIYAIHEILANQKLFQLRITNNSGADSNIEFAFMRVV